MPESSYILFHVATALAKSEKSRQTTDAMHRAQQLAKQYTEAPVPLHLRNAPTKLMKELGHGKDYHYPHDAPGHFVKEVYLPEDLVGQRYYKPGDQGYEQRISERLRRWWSGESNDV